MFAFTPAHPRLWGQQEAAEALAEASRSAPRGCAGSLPQRPGDRRGWKGTQLVPSSGFRSHLVHKSRWRPWELREAERRPRGAARPSCFGGHCSPLAAVGALGWGFTLGFTRSRAVSAPKDTFLPPSLCLPTSSHHLVLGVVKGYWFVSI